MLLTHPKWDERTVDNLQGACHEGVGILKRLDDDLFDYTVMLKKGVRENWILIMMYFT